jgi:uncharacterized membrane protein
VTQHRILQFDAGTLPAGPNDVPAEHDYRRNEDEQHQHAEGREREPVRARWYKSSMADVRARRTERWFKAALLLKGLDGAAELVGAVALLLVPAATVHRLVADVVSRDLLGPPDGFLTRHLVAGTAEFASGNRTFVLVYLGLHGVVKLALVWALLRKWRPAYPSAAVVLGVFVGYELLRAVRTGSLVLPFLAALDVLIIVLILREYRLLRTISPGR